MKGLIAAAAALALVPASFASAASEPPDDTSGMIAVRPIEAVALVLKADPLRRTMTIKNAHGKLVVIDVPPEMPADFIRPGSLLDIRYVEAEALTIAKPDAVPDEFVLAVRIASQPGSAADLTAHPKRVTGKIAAIDRDRRELTVLGPDSKPIALKVAGAIEGFDELKAGDVAAIEYTEAVALSAVKHDESQDKQTRM
jgi:hypothetical protein